MPMEGQGYLLSSLKIKKKEGIILNRSRKREREKKRYFQPADLVT